MRGPRRRIPCWSAGMTGRFVISTRCRYAMVLRSYLHERLRLRIYAPVALGITILGIWSAGRPLLASPRLALADAVSGVAAVLALCLQFRLWDDLEDREHDRQTHPERVLVAWNSPTPFRVVLAGLSLANVGRAYMANDDSPLAAQVLGGFMLWTWIAYRRLRPRFSGAAWRYIVLLSKYPIFVLVIAFSLGSPPATRIVVAMCTVYLCAFAYEGFHDGPAPERTRVS